MQMGDSCKDCRSWEEEIFWTHFQSIHFSQSLRGDFVEQLEIPEKFAKNIKKKLPEAVTLKGPSGIIWDVGLKADDQDTLIFARGWKNFVKDHSLVENDFLIFKYNGVSHFDVLMFDGQSLCEKAASYFVRKCTHTEYDSGCQTKRKMNENPVEVTDNSPPCGLESSPEKSTNIDIDMKSPIQPTSPAPPNKKMRKVVSSNGSRQLTTTAVTNKKKQKVVSSNRPLRTRQGRSGKELSTFGGEVKFETDFERASMDGDVFSPQHASSRKPATQAEKANAILMAQEVLTKEGFMVVMKPTHVGRRYYMAIPTAWVAQYLPKENDDVILRIKQLTWKTRFYYHRSRDCGGLSGGWRNFVIDNNLEEDDVCVFEPANLGLGERPIILDVTIFRILQAPVPLTQVQPYASGEV